MIRITTIKVFPDFKLNITFSDGYQLIFDVKPHIGEDVLTQRLKDKNFFSQVKICENGRGIYWHNEFDFCPDYLRYYSNEKAKVA